MAESSDNQNELKVEVDLVNGDESSLQEQTVSKVDAFKTLIKVSGEASESDGTEQVEVPQEVTLTGETSGDIHTQDGTVIGAYEVVNQTIALTVLPQEENVEGVVSLDSEWDQEKVEELSGAQELSFRSSTAEQKLNVAFEEVVEEEAVEEEAIEEEATEDVTEEALEEVVEEDVKEEEQEEATEEEVKEEEQEEAMKRK